MALELSQFNPLVGTNSTPVPTPDQTIGAATNIANMLDQRKEYLKQIKNMNDIKQVFATSQINPATGQYDLTTLLPKLTQIDPNFAQHYITTQVGENQKNALAKQETAKAAEDTALTSKYNKQADEQTKAQSALGTYNQMVLQQQNPQQVPNPNYTSQPQNVSLPGQGSFTEANINPNQTPNYPVGSPEYNSANLVGKTPLQMMTESGVTQYAGQPDVYRLMQEEIAKPKAEIIQPIKTTADIKEGMSEYQIAKDVASGKLPLDQLPLVIPSRGQNNVRSLVYEKAKELSGDKNSIFNMKVEAQWDKFKNDLNPLKGTSTGQALGQAGVNNLRADRALAILTDPNITTDQVVYNLAEIDIAGVMQGGVPHDIELQNASYPTWKKQGIALWSKISDKPELLNQPQIKQQLINILTGLRDVDGQVITANKDINAVAYRGLINSDPKRAEDLFSALEETKIQPKNNIPTMSVNSATTENTKNIPRRYGSKGSSKPDSFGFSIGQTKVAPNGITYTYIGNDNWK